MPFDEQLAARIRTHLGQRSGLSEKKMFGGIAFLVKGNMCCGVHRESLIVRLDRSETDRALSEPHTRVFDLTGRPMKGWILVEAAGLRTAAQLRTWVDRAAKYAGSLPAKCAWHAAPTREARGSMSHTLKVIAGGLLLLGLLLLAARFVHAANPIAGMAAAARWFVPIWLVGAAINLWVGVAKAGYSVAEELPIFLVVFGAPAAVAILVAWSLSRG
jgi:TfoX/Sxy family transcriptional regulator of competence genes